MTNIVKLDVSILEPPQPMREICQALTTLSQDEVLHVIHRRKPIPLFDMLKQEYAYKHIEKNENCHYIFIWHKDDFQAAEYVRTFNNENDRA